MSVSCGCTLVLKCPLCVEQALTRARSEAFEEAAKIAENHHVIHGDHYAAYSAPSTDGKELAAAIRQAAPASDTHRNLVESAGKGQAKTPLDRVRERVEAEIVVACYEVLRIIDEEEKRKH